MILVDLELTNYKQYAGSHRIEFPEQGAVAIIGNNGVGKTTLFEAIEWCLYNPRHIPNDEIPPRGGVGDTKVKLVLEDPRDRARFVVERTRRRRGVDAEIYREDQPELPIVKGTRDVTEFVRHRLIGLSHRAFVSTFFTRQKELSFFGDLKETERRREVAQLLGFETIRAAQAIISDERTVAKNQYQALSLQYEEERRDRDFAAEVVQADNAITAATEAVEAAAAHLAACEDAHRAARTELERWTARQRDDADLARESERLAGDLRTAEAEHRSAEEHLARLAVLEQDRLALLPKRQAEDAAYETLVALDALREGYQRIQIVTQTRQRAQTVVDDAIGQAQRLVRSTDPRGGSLPNWRWRAGDGPVSAFDSLLAAIDELDPGADAAYADQLDGLVRTGEDRRQAQQKLKKYTERLNEVERELKRLRAAGDPAERIAALEQARDAARHQEQGAIIRGQEYTSREADLERTIAAIQAASKQPQCPTCHRPLTPEDAELAIAPLRDQIEECRRRRQDSERQARAAQLSLKETEAGLVRERQRLSEEQTLSGKLETGSDYVQAAENELRQRDDEYQAQLAALDRDTDPAEHEVRDARCWAEVTQRVASQRGIVVHLRDLFIQADGERQAASEELAALGEVAYDPEEHQRARATYAEIREAIARLDQIDQSLAHRGQYEQQRAVATTTVATVTTQLDELRRRRADLGFDRGQLAAATAAEGHAADGARAADRALAVARSALEAAAREREALREQHARIEQLARSAERRRREQDELDRMYREFTRFDQYVAQLVTPQLADYTGELLAEVTDHKYDHVTFDDNYGLRVFDGPEHFAIDQFSGGERDVAALCARLALSRFIGSQAAHPPQFLVLDEVFGSLDADRRTHVLNALLQLAGNEGPFRQLFIISHVEDVRSSPALDEVWRIREVDGASTVENISRSLSVEDL